jgi:hypothetical protein
MLGPVNSESILLQFCTKALDLDEPQHLVASKTELLPFYSLLQGTESLPIPTLMQPP